MRREWCAAVVVAFVVMSSVPACNATKSQSSIDPTKITVSGVGFAPKSNTAVNDAVSVVPYVARRHFVIDLRDNQNQPLPPGPIKELNRLQCSVERKTGSGSGSGKSRSRDGWQHVPIDRYDRLDSSVLVTHTVGRTGRYRVSIRWDDKPIPGSPFIARLNDLGCCTDAAAPPTVFESAYECDAAYNSSRDPRIAMDLARWSKIERSDLPTDLSVSRHYTLIDNQLYSRGSRKWFGSFRDVILSCAELGGVWSELLNSARVNRNG